MRHDGHEEVTIKQEELDHLNKFILQAVNIKEFATEVFDKIEDIVLNDPTEFADDEGTVSVDESLVDKQTELVWLDKYPEIITPTIIYEEVWEKLDWNKIDKVVEQAEEIVRELREEQRAHQNNPLKAVGMKQSDFL